MAVVYSFFFKYFIGIVCVFTSNKTLWLVLKCHKKLSNNTKTYQSNYIIRAFHFLFLFPNRKNKQKKMTSGGISVGTPNFFQTELLVLGCFEFQTRCVCPEHTLTPLGLVTHLYCCTLSSLSSVGRARC